ncbi:hypothetical protein Syun_005722 [Stephania yunnanensis]|uniref:Uncharacterized protein n=1 Tax=Stephania yunnanensis TaxID=152371 RepID=A0AAP0KVA6_9MAGN
MTEDMARSKAVVIREEIDSEPLGGARGRGAMSTRARKGVLQDGGSHIAENRERDSMIARGGSAVKPPRLLRTHLGMKKENKIMWVLVAMVEANEGHEPHEALEAAEVGEGVEVGVAPDP